MWSLESRMTSDSMEAGRHFLQQERLRLLDPDLFVDGAEGMSHEAKHMSRSEWLSLLRRQELLHRMEMERWEEALAAATELLRKVSSNLFSNLLSLLLLLLLLLFSLQQQLLEQ